MGYREFVKSMQDSFFIISDSGTAQEEPALLDIPVVVPRDFTERPQSVKWNNSIMMNIDNKSQFDKCLKWCVEPRHSSSDWLGDGNTSFTIVERLRALLL